MKHIKLYSDFVLSGNQKSIDAVFNANSLDVDVSRKEIEQFLLKQKVYVSSVKIAKKLLKDLAKEVDKDFKDITKAGFQRNYLV